jgi:hypothetical protein
MKTLYFLKKEGKTSDIVPLPPIIGVVSIMTQSLESPRPSYRKLLSSLFLIKELGYEVTMDGLAEILQGERNEETAPFFESPVFGSLPSLSSKKIKGRIHYLVRRGYLELSYSEEEEDYYLRLNEKGLEAAKPSEVVRKKKLTPSKKNVRKIP